MHFTVMRLFSFQNSFRKVAGSFTNASAKTIGQSVSLAKTGLPSLITMTAALGKLVLSNFTNKSSIVFSGWLMAGKLNEKSATKANSKCFINEIETEQNSKINSSDSRRYHHAHIIAELLQAIQNSVHCVSVERDGFDNSM